MFCISHFSHQPFPIINHNVFLIFIQPDISTILHVCDIYFPIQFSVSSIPITHIVGSFLDAF